MAPAGSSTVQVGDLLAGKYRVERVLGVGGMGIVVAAREEARDRSVAIKFVRDDAMGAADVVERFLREARAAGKLKSEHVAKVLEVGKLESGAPYMVMELLEGSDLGQALNSSGPMSVGEACGLVLQACEAVAEAHGAGIVHRDLKPQNLFLASGPDGVQMIKVLDFGVSKALGLPSGEFSLTRTRAMVGSPLYMAPEQMRSSRDVDARVDVWALGVVLFELLTQRWPFEAETMPELCLKVVSEAPIPMTVFRSDLPAELVAVVDRCLEKDPKKRFADAAELASALAPFASSDGRELAERARTAIARAAEARTTPLEGVVAVGPRPRGDRAVAWIAGAFLVSASVFALLTPAQPSSPREDDEAEVESFPLTSKAAAASPPTVPLAAPRETAPLAAASRPTVPAADRASSEPVTPAMAVQAAELAPLPTATVATTGLASQPAVRRVAVTPGPAPASPPPPAAFPGPAVPPSQTGPSDARSFPRPAASRGLRDDDIPAIR
jgi:serine/threonine-protein kinase